MDEPNYERIAADQAQMLDELRQQMAALADRLPPVEAPPPQPGQYSEFPRILYRPGGLASQVDHPGNETLKVSSQREMEAACADGWGLVPILPTDKPVPAPPIQPAPVAKGKK